MARAQHNLATAYAEGKGIPQNYAKAAEWFTKAANAGLGASQYSLAMIHERGLVTGSPDLAKARTWYEKAVAQGDAQASERLALIERRLPLNKPPKTGEASPAPSAPAVSSTPDAPAPVSAVGRDEIREIQSLLAQMNFNPGPADGQMGRRTVDAIRLYQQFAGIEIDGAPTKELLEDMRAVAGSMSKGG
jgi:localization factor PodJL